MTVLNFHKPVQKLLIVGPIYDRMDKLLKISQKIQDYDLVIFNGNLCYPFHDLQAMKARMDAMMELTKDPKIIYNLGNCDWQVIHRFRDDPMSKIGLWLSACPNVVMATVGYNPIVVISGGITPHMNKNNLQNNIEVSFISKINNTPWHQHYGGGLGYIVSNNPLTQQEPQFYNFSAQIGNKYSENVKVYAMEIINNRPNHIFCL